MQAVLLKLPSNQFWRLRAKGAKVAVEESLYLGGGEPRRTSQIVLTAEPGANTVQWAIGRVQARRRGGGRLRNGQVGEEKCSLPEPRPSSMWARHSSRGRLPNPQIDERPEGRIPSHRPCSPACPYSPSRSSVRPTTFASV